MAKKPKPAGGLVTECREHVASAYRCLVALQEHERLDEDVMGKLFTLADDIMDVRRICYTMAANTDRRLRGEKAKALSDGIIVRAGGKKTASPAPVKRSAIVTAKPSGRRIVPLR